MPLPLPDFNLDEAQREFRDTLRRFFETHAPMTEVRRVMESDVGVSAQLWKRACDELGLAGIALPEDVGGQGFGLRGRRAAPSGSVPRADARARW